MADRGVINVMKWILIIINIPLLCAGAISIGIGAWGLGSEYGADKIKQLTGSELYRIAAIAIIVGGCVLITISFVGALGACLENRCLLGTYFTILLFLVIQLVLSAAVGFAYKDDMKKEMNKQMEYTMINQYMVNMDTGDINFATTTVWDEIQRKFGCCGVSGGLDSEKSWFLWQKSTWFQEQLGSNKDLVPSSCCVSDERYESCQKARYEDSTMPPQLYVNSSITKKNPDLNEMGCSDKLLDYIFDRLIPIGGIAIAILILMFFCVLLAACLCINIREKR